MKCDMNSTSAGNQTRGFPLGNSGPQENCYEFSADVPSLGIGQIPSDSPLRDEKIKKYQLLSDPKPNLLEADTSRIDRTAFKILGKEPHDTYPLLLVNDRTIVIMDALARIVPNSVLAHKSPTFWELIALALLILLPEGKRLRVKPKVS